MRALRRPSAPEGDIENHEDGDDDFVDEADADRLDDNDDNADDDVADDSAMEGWNIKSPIELGSSWWADRIHDDDGFEGVDAIIEAKAIELPDEIDDETIAGVIEQLVLPSRDPFTELRLELVGAQAVPAMIRALADPRFAKVIPAANLLDFDLDAAADHGYCPVVSLTELLAPHGASGAVAPLARLLNHPDRHVRTKVAKGLAGTALIDAVPHLGRVVASRDSWVIVAAVEGVQEAIESRRASTEFRRILVQPLADALEWASDAIGGDDDVANDASRVTELAAACLVGAPGGVEAVRRAVERGSIEFRCSVASGIRDALRTGLHDEAPAEDLYGTMSWLLASVRSSDLEGRRFHPVHLVEWAAECLLRLDAGRATAELAARHWLDDDAARQRLTLATGLRQLAITESARSLAARLLAVARLPARAEADAVHVALAAMHGIDYLLTWNVRHIASAEVRRHVETA